MLTADQARQLFEVRDGLLINRVRRNKSLPGSVAGSDQGNGYIAVKVDGVRYKAHRLVWLIEKGYWPLGHIDHINGNTRDNRIENLRDVTPRENMRNQRIRKSNLTGSTGVSRENGIWKARIKVDGKNIRLGSFRRFEDALQARKKAEVELEFHPNHGRTA